MHKEQNEISHYLQNYVFSEQGLHYHKSAKVPNGQESTHIKFSVKNMPELHCEHTFSWHI
jgi:hypothetical protein